MKTYYVEVPITGTINIEVQASSEQEAIEKALESDDLKTENITEWEAHEHVIQGNVFYGSLSSAEAVEE